MDILGSICFPLVCAVLICKENDQSTEEITKYLYATL